MAESTFPLCAVGEGVYVTLGAGRRKKGSIGEAGLLFGKQKDSVVLLATDFLKSLSFWESLQHSVCSEYRGDNNKASFTTSICSVEGKLKKIRELWYLLREDLCAPQNEGVMAACVGTRGPERPSQGRWWL